MTGTAAIKNREIRARLSRISAGKRLYPAFLITAPSAAVDTVGQASSFLLDVGQGYDFVVTPGLTSVSPASLRHRGDKCRLTRKLMVGRV
jgi:hypothetical protein